MGAIVKNEPGSTAVASRDAFGDALVRLGETHPELVVLEADLSESTRSKKFAKKFPERFFQMGIAEANMLGVAAGLSLAGKVPFCCSFACFVTSRFDQVRMSVCYSATNVRVVGSHAGVGIGEDGYSQMGLEDIALMRSLPTMTVIQPADDLETAGAVEALMTHKGPAFLRTTRQKLDARQQGRLQVRARQGRDAGRRQGPDHRRVGRHRRRRGAGGGAAREGRRSARASSTSTPSSRSTCRCWRRPRARRSAS